MMLEGTRPPFEIAVVARSGGFILHCASILLRMALYVTTMLPAVLTSRGYSAAQEYKLTS